MWMASAVLSDTSEAPGLQTSRRSPKNKPNSQLLAESLPWGGSGGTGQCLSHVCSHAHSPDLMPAPGELTARDGLAAPPRRARSRKVSCPLARSSGDLVGCGAWQEPGWGCPGPASALLLGASQPSLSPSLPVSVPQPLATGLLGPQHSSRTAQLLLPDRPRCVTLSGLGFPFLLWVGG